MSRFEYKLKTEDSNKPLKAIVKEQFAFSSRLMSKLRRAGAIKVNGEAVPNWIGLKPGDVVTVDMPEERSEQHVAKQRSDDVEGEYKVLHQCLASKSLRNSTRASTPSRGMAL